MLCDAENNDSLDVDTDSARKLMCWSVASMVFAFTANSLCHGRDWLEARDKWEAGKEVLIMRLAKVFYGE